MRCSGPFRLRRHHNSGFEDVARKVLRHVSLETSSGSLALTVWPETSSQFRVEDAVREVLRPAPPETSSEPRAPKCLDLRFSGPFGLRQPRLHTCGFQDAAREVLWLASLETSSHQDLVVREVLRHVSPETSSEPQAIARCPDLRCSGPFCLRHPHNSGFPDVVREVLRPAPLEASSDPRLRYALT